MLIQLPLDYSLEAWKSTFLDISDYFNENNDSLKTYYLSEKTKAKEISLQTNYYSGEDDFDTTMEANQSYLKKQINFLNKIINLVNLHSDVYSIQFNGLTQILIDEFRVSFNHSCEELFISIASLKDFSTDYSFILLLGDFISTNQQIVIIGGNGSGKTSLANYFKGGDKTNICVIPSEKSLYFSVNQDSLLKSSC